MSNTRTLPNPGTHPAKTNQPIGVYVTEQTGSLCAAICVTLADGSWSGKGTMVLVKGDGTPMDKNIATLREIFGWQTESPFDLEQIAAGEHEFDVVLEHEEYTPKPTEDEPDPQPAMGVKIKWFNSKGRVGIKMPEKLDESARREILTKFAGKFKVGGSAAPKSNPKPVKEKPAATEPPSRSAAPTPPSRKSGPGGTARTSTQQEVWTAYKKVNNGKPENELAEAYYAAQDEIAPNMNGELTPAQWGEVANKLGV
jgi:hypothetical protein